MSLIQSRLTFGCEPLGGTDWGVIDLVQIEAAIKLTLWVLGLVGTAIILAILAAGFKVILI